MSRRPQLHVLAAPADPGGVVLLLHGGSEHSDAAVHATQVAVLRMIPIARRAVRAGQGRLVVARLQDRVRGWNDNGDEPVNDARWALGRLRDRFGGLPVSLIGHSMGGRAAMRVADEAEVVSVVGLAPWLPRGEPIAHLRDRRVLIIHGTKDRSTSPEESAAFLEAAAPLARQTGLVLVRNGRHGMIRRRRVFEDLATDYAAATVLAGGPDGRTGSRSQPNLLGQVLTGTGPLII